MILNLQWTRACKVVPIFKNNIAIKTERRRRGCHGDFVSKIEKRWTLLSCAIAFICKCSRRPSLSSSSSKTMFPRRHRLLLVVLLLVVLLLKTMLQVLSASVLLLKCGSRRQKGSDDWLGEELNERQMTNGYVWKLSAHSVTPPKRGHDDGNRTFLESHVLTFSRCPLFGSLPNDKLKWK